MSAWLFGTRVGDAQQTRTILKTLVDNPINDPERTPPELAEYLNAAIPAFVAGFSTPRDQYVPLHAVFLPFAFTVIVSPNARQTIQLVSNINCRSASEVARNAPSSAKKS